MTLNAASSARLTSATWLTNIKLPFRLGVPGAPGGGLRVCARAWGLQVGILAGPLASPNTTTVERDVFQHKIFTKNSRNPHKAWLRPTNPRTQRGQNLTRGAKVDPSKVHHSPAKLDFPSAGAEDKGTKRNKTEWKQGHKTDT